MKDYFKEYQELSKNFDDMDDKIRRVSEVADTINGAINSAYSLVSDEQKDKLDKLRSVNISDELISDKKFLDDIKSKTFHVMKCVNDAEFIGATDSPYVKKAVDDLYEYLEGKGVINYSKKQFSTPEFLQRMTALPYLVGPFVAALEVNHDDDSLEDCLDEILGEVYNDADELNVNALKNFINDIYDRVPNMSSAEKSYLNDLSSMIDNKELPTMYSGDWDFDAVMEEPDFYKLQKFIKDHGKECWNGTFEGLVNPVVVKSIDGITPEDILDDEGFNVKEELIRLLIGDDTQEWHTYWRTKEGPHPQSAPSIL